MTPPESCLSESPDGVILHVKVIPNASRNQMEGLHGGALKIRLSAPPVDGKANEILVRILADQLGCHKRDIQLIRGQTARHKVLAIQGMTMDAVAAKLLAL